MDDRVRMLEDRLLRMERRQRWTRGLLLGLPAAALLLGAQGQKQNIDAKRVVAEELVVVDGNGRTRATLRAANDGAHLVLLDQTGRGRVRLAANPDGAGPLLHLYTAAEKTALAAGQSKDNGIGFVEFYDEGTVKGSVGGNALKAAGRK